MIHSKPLSLAIATVLLLPVPLLALSSSTDAPFRDCMSQIVTTRENDLMTSMDRFTQEQLAALRNRLAEYRRAWTMEDDRANRTIIRDADRTYNDVLRAARLVQKDADRNAKNVYRDGERRCRDEMRQRKDEARRIERETERLAREAERIAREDAQRFRQEVSYQTRPTYDSSRIGTKCLSSDMCGTGLVCTTIYGACESACEPGAQICVQACAGRCVTTP